MNYRPGTNWKLLREIAQGAAIAILTLTLCMLIAFQASAAEVEAMAKYSHGSDIVRGCPFRCEISEPQYDAITGGITITAGKCRAWELDLSHGFKWIDRGPSETGSEFAVRFYPGRRRNK
jgi:hypothetical protein